MLNKKDYTERFAEVCGNKRVTEVASLLGISYQAARNYLGGRLPGSAVLLTIAEKTPYSLHWLLTGKGEKFVADTDAPLNTLLPSDQIRIFVREELSEILKENSGNKTAIEANIENQNDENAQVRNISLISAKIKYEKPTDQSDFVLEKQINEKKD